MRKRGIILLLLSLTTGGANAEIYKWVDENGRVHFDDRPRGSSAQTVEVNPLNSPSPPTLTEEQRKRRQRRLIQVLEEDRLTRKVEAERKASEEQERKRRCLLAKDRLGNIQRASYLYDVDDSGGRTIYSEQQRVQVTARAEQDVKRWCH